jgi:hypothetical protein
MSGTRNVSVAKGQEQSDLLMLIAMDAISAEGLKSSNHPESVLIAVAVEYRTGKHHNQEIFFSVAPAMVGDGQIACPIELIAT